MGYKDVFPDPEFTITALLSGVYLIEKDNELVFEEQSMKGYSRYNTKYWSEEAINVFFDEKYRATMRIIAKYPGIVNHKYNSAINLEQIRHNTHKISLELHDDVFIIAPFKLLDVPVLVSELVEHLDVDIDSVKSDAWI